MSSESVTRVTHCVNKSHLDLCPPRSLFHMILLLVKSIPLDRTSFQEVLAW